MSGFLSTSGTSAPGGEEDSPGAVLRQTRDRRQADAWALVLASQGLPSRLIGHPGGWVVAVAAADAPRALTALAAYDAENRPARGGDPPQQRQPRPWSATLTALAAVLGLVAFHATLVASGRHDAWILAGGAAGGAILSGEWWRGVTALTLHADVGHVAANAFFGALFLGALCLRAGPGVGLALTVAGGVAGNLANAALRGATYAGIGASGAVFAAVGVTAGLMARAPMAQSRGDRWRRVVAGVALLALFGSAERTDVLGHLLGFLAGLGIGAVAARWVTPPPGPGAQGLAAAATAATLVAAWAWALVTWP